jgi:hypothetical protein
VLRERGLHARHQVAAIRLVVGMLQLASAALGEVPARRFLVVRTRRERSVVEQRIAGHSERHRPTARRHAVTAPGDSDDQLMRRGDPDTGQLPASSSASASA